MILYIYICYQEIQFLLLWNKILFIPPLISTMFHYRLLSAELLFFMSWPFGRVTSHGLYVASTSRSNLTSFGYGKCQDWDFMVENALGSHIRWKKQLKKILREWMSPRLKLIEKPNAMSQRYNNSFHLGPDPSLRRIIPAWKAHSKRENDSALKNKASVVCARSQSVLRRC